MVAQHEVDQARLVRERERAAEAKREEAAQLAALETFAGRYRETLSEWESVQESIGARTEKNRQLRARLPDTVTSREYRNELKRLRREHDEWQAQRASRLQELRTLFAERRDAITAKSGELVEAFSKLVEVLLVEEVRLVQVKVEPRYLEAPGRTGERVEVPAYAAELTAAARPAMTRRRDPSEVSESQRELIDLAFRLALVGVFGGASTFAMETPEASLDAISMERVGRALARFASSAGNRLVVTTNLTNGGIVTAMFEATEPESGQDTRLAPRSQPDGGGGAEPCIGRKPGALPGVARGDGGGNGPMSVSVGQGEAAGRHLAKLKRRCRVLLLLDSAEQAGIAPLPSPRLHAFAYLADVLSPVWKLVPFDGKVYKSEGGPRYPDLQDELDSLVVLGLVQVSNLVYEPSAGGGGADFGLLRVEPSHRSTWRRSSGRWAHARRRRPSTLRIAISTRISSSSRVRWPHCPTTRSSPPPALT